ncbi:6,7-dimethyl-8-ribityllumazine synthase [Lactiplantibacillus paraplantarum]|uniref:6,7-dimethyl-8-ribityllumazine synthase n=1 Tax=Lactiplantibacillus paraplantarum TaxID=60520 RepID=A0AAD0TW52_9LACO|nr:6,7-dimethyl-8-ribityllumazine synthase [Lactiplantibacillus paraplantarum]AVW10116.1 6,7-dimethyl-8-ribityllumazine synthase [Lactiplantibacillus paraplantarum]AYJ38365.1 6,7-dimethyl-8-ribityllumazine synthase [Lactiplantibacillus paraplantarum]ERL44262.1 riboflavin synthase, beta chain [Lactiplantibacillus paraplantarum]KRL46279.1 riboflavin synthase, beta chain [Lactiplantibacillus paraplantarum DSM 10667]MCU4683434.1 6,7-dimethyl-8-ribityllumazine synthase [Lactiplantibacillus paraplan
MTTFNGKIGGNEFKVGIVVARFNAFVTQQLLAGAQASLEQHGVNAKDIDVAWVPGAFEIPLTVQKMIATKRYDGVIALGAVIRGATAHFDYVCSGVTTGVMTVSLATDTPVMFGILTTDTIEQAMDRAGFKSGNKGADCAVSLLETLDVQRSLEA